MIRFIISLILIVWELPQNILGCILLSFYKPDRIVFYRQGKKPERIIYYSDRIDAGISLGGIIIVPTKAKTNTIAHEYGHSIQSMMFGPLYLLVIGIPSILWNIHWRGHLALDYYSFWTEKWADKLGKVKR